MTASLVTGASGFVGSHLVRRLVGRGDRVVATDVRGRADLPVPVSCADVTDAAALGSLVAGMDVVFHAASLVQTSRAGADRVWAVNLGGTRALLVAARDAGVKRFVYVSSASVVYEGRDIEGVDESAPYARGSLAPYADSKIAAEKEVRAADAPGAMRTCAIRPHVIFGPGDRRFFPAVVARARAGQLRLGVGSGTKLSDFTYIDNVIDALVLADEALARDPALGSNAYFVTDGEPMGFWDFVDRVLIALGKPKTVGRVPFPVAYAAAAIVEWKNSVMRAEPVPEDGMTRFAMRYLCTHHWFCIDRARRDLRYRPVVATGEGIARTVAAWPPE